MKLLPEAIWLAIEPVDMHTGADGLSLRVQQVLGRADLATIEHELESQAPAKRQRRRAGRQPLPPELLRIEHRHEPESCQCGADLVKIGEDVSEQLDVEPARFFVHRHIRPQSLSADKRHRALATERPPAK